MNGGQQVCVPPSDVLGSSPLGASCNASASTNACRSGACDPGTTPASCAQRCVPRGGCPAGFGCFPLVDPSSTTMIICARAGSGWLGDGCTRASECATGLCMSAAGYCTRMCVDGYCPTGMVCKDYGISADDGTPIKMCSL